MSGIATPEHFVSFGATGVLAAGTVAVPFFVAPTDLEIVNALARVTAAPTGGPTEVNFAILRADGSGTVNAFSTGLPIAAGALSSYAEQTQAFPVGAWPKPGPYALNDAQPGGSVAVAPTYTAQSVLPIGIPDLNTIIFAGDAVSLIIAAGTGNTALGSNLAGVLHLLKR